MRNAGRNGIWSGGKNATKSAGTTAAMRNGVGTRKSTNAARSRAASE
jgi:hypothetical protein